MKTDFSAKTSPAKLTKKPNLSKFRFTMLPSLIFISIFVLPLLSLSTAMATSGVFPEEPFDGIQSVSYTISGVTSTSYEDPQIQGMAQTSRIYKGILGTGTLRVQGTVTATDDLRSAFISVYVGLGAGGPGYSNEYRVEFGRGGQSFDVSMPIPTELDYAIKTFGADFSIFVNVLEYHDDVWGLIDGGTFGITGHFDASSTAPGNHAPTVSLNYTPAQPIVGSPINFTATGADADGDTLSYAWYLAGALQSGAKTTTVNWSQPSIGAHTLKVVVSNGNGGMAEDIAEFTVINEAKPYIIAPGYQEGEGEAWGFVDKIFIDGQEVVGIEKTLLYTGSQIKTGPGVEILIRTSFGAVTRVKENAQYEVEERKLQTPTCQEILGRLKKGVCEFYWPKGYEGAKKFEVSTNRVVVGIKGTSFTVSHAGDTSTVTVQEGVVEVTNLDTGAVSQVHSGEILTVSYKSDGDLAPLGSRDGVINVGDALVALRFALLLEIPTQEDMAHGDIAPLDASGHPNPDGQITVGDALVILRRALGLITFVEF